MFNTSLPAIVVPARTILALAALLLGSISWSHASIVDNWLVSFHNCPGAYRTDALHRDSDGTLWVGCGTAAEGYGLFYSEDGGGSWAAAPVTPASKLAKFRVSSIVRGSNGQLRIAGFNAETKEMVLSLNTTSKPFAVTPFLVSVAQVGRQFHVGTYVELADGRGIAESLNGHDLLYREPDTATSSASTWVSHTPSSQILDLTSGFGRFWAVGGSIDETPKQFLPPSPTSSTPYQFTVSTWPGITWEGELWGISVDEYNSIIRRVAVGVNQDANIGNILGQNPSFAHSMSDIIGNPTAKTWGRGVCTRGDTVVAVGERQPTSAHTGLILLSTNAGGSFVNITPPDVKGSVSKCLFEPDGTLVVVGSGGFVGILPPDLTLFEDGFED